MSFVTLIIFFARTINVIVLLFSLGLECKPKTSVLGKQYIKMDFIEHLWAKLWKGGKRTTEIEPFFQMTKSEFELMK